jgi:hypothetical protein
MKIKFKLAKPGEKIRCELCSVSLTGEYVEAYGMTYCGLDCLRQDQKEIATRCGRPDLEE